MTEGITYYACEYGIRIDANSCVWNILTDGWHHFAFVVGDDRYLALLRFGASEDTIKICVLLHLIISKLNVVFWTYFPILKQ
jgi:hypothetical protein